MAMQWEHLQLHLVMIFPFKWFDNTREPIFAELSQRNVFEEPFFLRTDSFPGELTNIHRERCARRVDFDIAVMRSGIPIQTHLAIVITPTMFDG